MYILLSVYACVSLRVCVCVNVDEYGGREFRMGVE